MSKIKPERIAGIVALSYLVLIPAGGIFAYLKIRQLEQDVSDLWDSMPNPKPVSDQPTLRENLLQGFRRNT